jgi:hypothetical protein
MTDWFLARADEAEAVAQIVTTGERSFDDWPHVSFPLIQIEIMALYAALTGGEPVTTLELPLVLEEDIGLVVARVVPPLVEALAELEVRSGPAVVTAWAAALDHGEPEVLGDVLTELAALARGARELGLPILQMVTY